MKRRLPVILLMLLASGCAALPASVLDSDAIWELPVLAVYSTDTGRSRFRAAFLTSLTTFCRLIPLILKTSEEAQFLIPMAVSLAFGILVATLITLIVIPVLAGIQLDAMAPVGGSESAAETLT